MAVGQKLRSEPINAQDAEERRRKKRAQNTAAGGQQRAWGMPSQTAQATGGPSRNPFAGSLYARPTQTMQGPTVARVSAQGPKQKEELPLWQRLGGRTTSSTPGAGGGGGSNMFMPSIPIGAPPGAGGGQGGGRGQFMPTIPIGQAPGAPAAPGPGRIQVPPQLQRPGGGPPLQIPPNVGNIIGGILGGNKPKPPRNDDQPSQGGGGGGSRPNLPPNLGNIISGIIGAKPPQAPQAPQAPQQGPPMEPQRPQGPQYSGQAAQINDMYRQYLGRDASEAEINNRLGNRMQDNVNSINQSQEAVQYRQREAARRAAEQARMNAEYSQQFQQGTPYNDANGGGSGGAYFDAAKNMYVYPGMTRGY